MIGRKFLYKGRVYSNNRNDRLLDNYGGDIEDLMQELEDNDAYESEEVTNYFVGGEFIGNDADMDDEDVIDFLIDYGVDKLEEILQ